MSARASLVNRASMSTQPVSLLCQYNTGILSPREEGGRGGGRTEEGGGERGGKERRGEQMSVVRGSCGPWSLTKMSVFHYFTIFGCLESCVFGPVEGVFAGMQQSTVKLAVPGLSCYTDCQHNVTVYKQYRQEEATGAL